VKKIFRILGYSLVIIIFMMAIIIGMTQTAIFKDWVRQFVEKQAAEHLNGELRIGKVSGTFITGISLKDVEWWYENERVIHIPSLDIRINPARLTGREIVIDNVVLLNPDVRFIKDEDGVLNISRLVKQREEKTMLPDTINVPVSEPWLYHLNNIEIIGGEFSFENLSGARRMEHDYPVAFPRIDYNDINIGNVYLSMSALSDGRNHTFDVRSLSLFIVDPAFAISHFSLQASFSPDETLINRLRLITDRSNVNITGSISDYNLLGGRQGSIEDKNMHITLFADRFHFDDLKMFIPNTWFLEGDAEFDISVRGTLQEARFDYASIKVEETDLLLRGIVQNVTRGREMFIDVVLDESRLDPRDVNSLLPHFTIPDYSHIGVVDITASYKGQPQIFNSVIKLNTSAGFYTGDVDFDLTGSLLAYDGSVTVRHADVNTLLQNKYYPNDVSGRIMVKGRGTNFTNLDTELQFEIDRMNITYLGFDSLIANMYVRNHDLRLISTGYLEQSKFSIDATSEIITVEQAPFDVQLIVESLDLARIMRDSTYLSDLSFSLSATGSGFLPESMLADIAIELSESRFRDYTFVGDPIYISMTEIDTVFRELNIRSEIFDIYLAGEFDLPTIFDISYDHVRQLVSSIKNDIQGIITGEPVGVHEYLSTISIQKPLETLYDIDIKDMNAIALFLGRDQFDLEVEGKIYGYFRALDNMLHLGGDIEIDHFMYLSEDERFLFDKVVGWYNIDNDFNALGLDGIFSVFDVSASGVYYESLKMNDVQVRADIRGSDWNVYSKSVIDSVASYEVNTVAHFNATSLNTDIIDLNIAYGEIDFSNIDTLRIYYDQAGIWFESFSLYHNDISSIQLSGLYAFDKEHSIDFNIGNLDVREIHRISAPDAEQRRQPLINGSINISGSVAGRTDSLYSQTDVRITDVEYGELSFGILTGSFKYDKDRLDFHADVTEIDDTSNIAFRFTGYMPFDLFPGRDGNRIPDGPINVHLFSEGFDLSIVDPFLRDLRNFRARMTSDIYVSGTVENPVYEGNLEFTDGYFILSANNIAYHFNGQLVPQQNELAIRHFRLENRTRDFQNGRINFSGSARTRGLSIRDFDLRADGQLLALRTASRRPADVFYGDLIVATGPNGISLSGSMDESRLSGNLLIRSASLTFPPARTSVYERTGSIVNYIIIDEVEESQELTPLEIFFRDMAREQAKQLSGAEAGGSFLDGLDYDIVLQTEGRVEMTMVFNQATGEELVARIETTGLRLYRDDLTGLRLIGSVNIVEPSGYTFYRKFEARGRLSFVGAPDNPELDITATYHGQRIPIRQTVGQTDEFTAVDRGIPEPVEVRLHITGDRYEPKLDINLIVNNVEWEGDVETDAISYILTGRFQTELESGDYRSISADFGRAIPATFMSGVATSLLSNLLSEFLRNEIRFIRTAEIIWYGGNIMDTAELRISGELRNFYWTIGGRVFNDIGNTNFSFQIPMGPVFNSDRWTNLFLELERRSQSIEFYEDQRPVNAARLYYSISF
jgi:hypothetical protein